ncbi:hypothetical protein [Streptomyces sp. NPDC088775]|uniref:hypothetical protein n=1 Tax=Streptomyces sp. NPDC088775 TaxID=3365896 RepID=UPI00381FEC7C
MSLDQALERTAVRQREIEQAARIVQGEMLYWLTRLDPSDLLGSWFGEVLPGLYRSLMAGQARAAGGAGEFVAEAAALMGLDASTAYRVVPAAFARSAADGRPLTTMLTTPVLRARLAVEQRGQSPVWALGQARTSILLMGSSETIDAGRGAAQTAMAGTRSVTGYIRCINAGACKRCAVLAGRWYRWNADFLRHKRCQCYGTPAGGDGRDRARRSRNWRTDPAAYFNRLSTSDQVRVFGRGGAEAIRAGADIGQVVNARRTAASLSRSTLPDGQRIVTTIEGTGRRSSHFARIRRELEQIEGRPMSRIRLTPESIFRLSADRQELVRLLGRHGYLVRSSADIARL